MISTFYKDFREINEENWDDINSFPSIFPTLIWRLECMYLRLSPQKWSCKRGKRCGGWAKMKKSKFLACSSKPFIFCSGIHEHTLSITYKNVYPSHWRVKKTQRMFRCVHRVTGIHKQRKHLSSLSPPNFKATQIA